MASVVRLRASALLAEQRSVRGVVEQDAARTTEPDFDPAHYLGATSALIDRLLDRATRAPRSEAGQEDS